MSKKISPHVLLVAYDCAPNKGSASLIGWQWYSRLAKRVPVTLVTHIRNQKDLFQAGAPVKSSQLIFIDTEWFAKPLCYLAEKLFPHSDHAQMLLCSPDFYLYDFITIHRLKQALKNGAHWDIIHLVTPLSPVTATRLHVLKRPVILGPWNGGLKTPTEFPEIMREDSSWLYSIRRLGYLIDFCVGTTRRAATIFTATQATWQSIPTHSRARCQFMLENGVDLTIFQAKPWPQPPSLTNPLRLIFVGRLQAFKGLPMLLTAIAQLKKQIPLQLTVVGDGSLREKWQQHAHQLQIAQLITWHTAMKQTEVAAKIQAAHVLCLPSVRESGGAVLLEAMACARPVLTINYGGPAEIVDDEVGRAISPVGGAPAVIAGLVEELHDIFQNSAQWRRRGEEGRRRAELFYDWEVKIERALALYQKLLK